MFKKSEYVDAYINLIYSRILSYKISIVEFLINDYNQKSTTINMDVDEWIYSIIQPKIKYIETLENITTSLTSQFRVYRMDFAFDQVTRIKAKPVLLCTLIL